MAKKKVKRQASTFDPNSDPNTYKGGGGASGGSQGKGATTQVGQGNTQGYDILGNPKFLGGGQNVPGYTDYDTTPSGGRIAFHAPGYVKGDQFKLLPTNGTDLSTLQQALVQAGFITTAQAKKMVLGSPDEVTSAAFAKLLATANMSGSNWRDALSARLTTSGQQAPSGGGGGGGAQPLTIKLSNPDDIKKTANDVAKTLYGGNLPDDVLNNFVSSYQQMESQYQTQPAGGTLTDLPALGTAAENMIKTNPATKTQYQATQFGTQVQSALSSLRSTGYL